jgi:hypothetical protein
MTTVYSYIFRISSGSEEAAAAVKQAPSPVGAPLAAPVATTPVNDVPPFPPSRRRSNGHGGERPGSMISERSSRLSVIDMPMPAKTPPREVTEAVRLVRSLTDTRDSDAVS